MKTFLVIMLLVLPLLVSCGPGSVIPSGSTLAFTDSSTAPFTPFATPETAREITPTPSPLLSPIPSEEDEVFEVVHIMGGDFFPIYYIQVHEIHELIDFKGYEAQILGAYYQGRFISWRNIGMGEESLHIFDYLDKYEEEHNSASDVQTVLASIGDSVRIYTLDGTIVNTKITREPSIYTDEGGLFFCTSLTLGDRKERLPIGHYFGVTGDWNPMPRPFHIIDSLGSIEIDLDGNGAKDYLHIRTFADPENDVDFLKYSIELNGIEYEITDMIPDSFAPGENYPYMNAHFFPIDVNDDEIYEVFLVVQTRDPFNVYLYSLDDDIGAAKLKYSIAP